jgi:Ca-activated chloride channel homolog
VRTELVVLPVKVTDANGNFVSGLSKQDFRVYEDGRPQEVTFFQQADLPVTVGLIVDHSRSMGPKLSDVADAISDFAQSSNSQDEMFVVDFNDGVSMQLLGGKPFTNDAKELEKAVAGVSAQGRTALYDAIAEGLHHLQLAHLDKRALVIVSDGGDNASHQKYSQILALARRSQVLIYSIVLVDANGEQEENPNILRRLSKDTGGVVYFPRESESVANVSAEIARDLREQYTIGYVPQKMTDAEAFRKIKVQVIAPGHGRLRVRTRQGYSPAAEKHSTTQLGSGTR